ncbi:MAG: alpha/beta hydrolase [Alphaproteobacteria bacterium]|nr:alpha/beta hydrolase [Alphaproteobacteria bacterium]MBV9420884.1 alpha/beta hydrolase [Alphaproteobacteria bacterium]
MQGRKDVVFAKAGDVELKLDIVVPEKPNGIGILFVHGGGWRMGSREMMAPMMQEMAKHGFTGIASQYRLNSPKGGVWPAHIHDTKAAIRWTREHAAELGIDPERIVLWGSSAGAHLVLLAAGTPDDPKLEGDIGPKGFSSKVAAVIAVHAPTGFHVSTPSGKHTSPLSALTGHENGTEDDAKFGAPMSYVSANFPPTLLLHGTVDRVVHHSQSQVMFDALRAARAPVDMHLYSGHRHGFARLPSMRKQVAAEAAYFLDRMVVNPKRYQDEIDSAAAEQAALQARQAAAR